MSKPNIEEIRERCEAASSGPWKMSNYRPMKIIQRNPTESTYEVGDDKFSPIGSMNEPKDSWFCAHARSDIPALLNYITDLESELVRKEEALRGLQVLQTSYQRKRDGYDDMDQSFKWLIELPMTNEEWLQAKSALSQPKEKP